jgi:hypothetical protein
MTIRINLLAEAQALEELRRRDPVKRAIWVGATLVAFVLVWSISLQVKAFVAKSELRSIEARLGAHTNEYQQVLVNQKKLGEIKGKLTNLHLLATNRFLNGNLLDALQHATADGVDLTHLKINQEYALIEETKPKTNGNRIIPGKPAVITEKIVVALDAKDFSISRDGFDKFRQTITASPYFQGVLGKTNEVRLSKLDAAQIGEDGRASQSFALECRLPEKTR